MTDADSVLNQLLSEFSDFEPIDNASDPQLIDIEGDHLNSKRFLAEHGNDLRHSPELNRWFVWNGAWWQEDLLETVRERARQSIDNLRQWTFESPDVDEFIRRAKHYRASTRANRIEGLLAVTRSSEEIVVEVRDLDKYPHFIACRNGTVDLKSGELLPPDRDLLLTRGVEIDYEPDTVAEEFQSFLNTIFGSSQEVIGYVQRFFGYSLTGEVSEHALAIFYGDGANGKTQLLNAVMYVMGSNAIAAPDGLLVQRKSTPHDERIATLRGRRLVLSSELEDESHLAEALVKQLTGGDRLSARHLYGQRFEFDPTHTLVLVTNHLPRVSGTDGAIWRRIKIVPFQVVISADDRIPDYGKQLAHKYGSAILSWMVQGAVKWYQSGLNEPELVKREVETFRAGEDVFAQFLEECTISDPGLTPVQDLLRAWSGWCKSKQMRVGRNHEFSRRLRSHGFDIESSQNAKFVRGVALRHPSTLFQDDLS